MNYLKEYSKKQLASEHLLSQIMGALTKSGCCWLFIALLINVVIIPLSSIWIHSLLNLWLSSWYLLLTLTIFTILTFSVCYTLTNIFSLHKNETGITWCQISILFGIGLWIIGFLLIFKVKEGNQHMITFGIIGSLLTWVFKDKIMGAVAFVHLRLHNLLCIGDWIKVPQFDVDGQVQRISLTTVTIYNWDTTKSTIPISFLHTNHFINLQSMMEGKTYGRRMCATFLFDTSWIHPISKEDAMWMNNIKDMKEAPNTPIDMERASKYLKYLSKNDLKEGVLNAQLFRLYIFHWLMNHAHISQQPRLIVRWLEQEKEGMPLQIYTFITDSTFAAFEWQQSRIIEHIIKSSEWFGMRLYQSPSAYDVSNSNIYLSPKPAIYRKENNDE